MVMPIAGGVGIATRTDGQPDSPSTPDTYFDGLIRDSAQQAWSDYRPQLQKALMDKLGLGDLITSGVTLYDIDLSIASDIDLSVERDDNGDLIVHLTTGGSSITATSTTPTDLGSWADPRFEFDFGLDLTYRIDLPPTTQPIASTGFDGIYVLSPKLDSQNFVADVIFMIDDIVDWFSGTDFIGILEGFIAATDFAPYVNNALQPLNNQLTALAGQGYWFMEAVVDRLDGGSGDLHGLSLPGAPAGRLDLLLTVYGFDLSGAIEGLISWPAALGQPTNLPPLEDTITNVHSSVLPTLAATTAAAIQGAKTSNWVAVTSPASAALVAAAPAAAPATGASTGAAQAPGAGAAAEQSSSLTQSVYAAADTALAGALEAMAPADRVVAANEARAGVAERYIALIGGAAQFAQLRAEFLRGRADFLVPVSVKIAGGGGGIIGDIRPVGTLSSLWADDDDTTFRRRFLVVNLPIDAPLTVSSDLAAGYRWAGSVAQVACTPSGWTGTVTVHHAPPRVPLSQALADQVEVRLADDSRIIGTADALQQRGIIIVGGTTAISDTAKSDSGEVALNPQPLPPHEVVGRLAQTAQTAQPRLTQGVAAIRTQGAQSHVLAPSSSATSIAATIAGHTSVTEAGAGLVGAGIDDGASLINEHVSAAAAAAAATFVRDNPEGNGTVRGIDFRVAEYHPAVVR